MCSTTAAEPAVVEHIALHSKACGALGKVGEAFGVVIEVDGLPDVQGHGAFGLRLDGHAANVIVEACRLPVEPSGVVEVDPRGRVTLPFFEAPFGGQQEFAAADELATDEVAFCLVDVVATPGNVRRPDLVVLVAEVVGRREDRRGIVAAAPMTVLAAVIADAEFGGLGDTFDDPTSSEVHQLAHMRGHREGQRQFLDAELGRIGVRERRPSSCEARRQHLDGQQHREAFLGGEVEFCAPCVKMDVSTGLDAVCDDLRQLPRRAPRGAIDAGSDEAGTTSPAVARLGDDAVVR